MTVNVTDTVGANNTIVLDGNSKIPAIDGSQVTALSATAFTTGTLATARIDVGTTAGKVLQLDGSARIPALSGANLTNVPGPTVSTSDPAIDSNLTLGKKWINKTSGEVYICTDATAGANVWTNVGAGSGDIEPFPAWGTQYGYMCGGRIGQSPVSTYIQRYSFASDGNAVDSANLIGENFQSKASSSATYGYVHGGANPWPTAINVIQKFNFSTQANATDIGDLTVARYHVATSQSAISGYSAGGQNATSPAEKDVIDKFPYASDANATDVGNLIIGQAYVSGHSSLTHGYKTHGTLATSGPQTGANGYGDAIEKFPFATDSNSSDVANMLAGRYLCGGTQSSSHGYKAGGRDGSVQYNEIEKFTFASDANSTDVGNLLLTMGYTTCSASTTHGYASGAYTGSAASDSINKWTFSSDANATDVGNLLVADYGGAGTQV